VREEGRGARKMNIISQDLKAQAENIGIGKLPTGKRVFSASNWGCGELD
jgi:hypothetical protein